MSDDHWKVATEMMTDAAQQPNGAKKDSEIVTLTTNVLEISDAGATIATGLNFIKMASVLCISLIVLYIALCSMQKYCGLDNCNSLNLFDKKIANIKITIANPK